MSILKLEGLGLLNALKLDGLALLNTLNLVEHWEIKSVGLNRDCYHDNS